MAGIAANEEWMETECHSQTRIANAGAGHAENRTICSQNGEFGNDFGCVAEAVHWLGNHAFEANDITTVGIL